MVGVRSPDALPVLTTMFRDAACKLTLTRSVRSTIRPMQNAPAVRRIRLLLGLFIFCLVASGLTAFPLRYETLLLAAWFGQGTRIAEFLPSLAWWPSEITSNAFELNSDGICALYV